MFRQGIVAGVALLLAACGTGEPIRSSAPVSSLAVMPASGELRVGETLQLFADPKDDRGRVLAERLVSGSSLDPAVASVSPEGVVTALAPGAARIVLSSEGKSATVTVTVRPVRGPVAECATPRPGWIWCDDFEEDRLARYFEQGNRQGLFERAAGVGYGGSAGMRARWTAPGQVDAGFLHVAFGKVPASNFRPVDAGTAIYRDVYWRVLVRYGPGWVGGGGNKMSRAQSLVTPQYAQAMIAHVWSGSTAENPTDRLAIVGVSGIGFRGSLRTEEYNDFPHFEWLPWSWSKTRLFERTAVGRWYCIETRAKLNDPGRSNGAFELWIDDRLEASQTGLGWMGSYRDYGINVVYLENYWNDGAPQAQERYFDNFVVSTQRIGCAF
jgi:hypothetical protein